TARVDSWRRDKELPCYLFHAYAGHSRPGDPTRQARACPFSGGIPRDMTEPSVRYRLPVGARPSGDRRPVVVAGRKDELLRLDLWRRYVTGGDVNHVHQARSLPREHLLVLVPNRVAALAAPRLHRRLQLVRTASSGDEILGLIGHALVDSAALTRFGRTEQGATGILDTHRNERRVRLVQFLDRLLRGGVIHDLAWRGEILPRHGRIEGSPVGGNRVA